MQLWQTGGIWCNAAICGAISVPRGLFWPQVIGWLHTLRLFQDGVLERGTERNLHFRNLTFSLIGCTSVGTYCRILNFAQCSGKWRSSSLSQSFVSNCSMDLHISGIKDYNLAIPTHWRDFNPEESPLFSFSIISVPWHALLYEIYCKLLKDQISSAKFIFFLTQLSLQMEFQWSSVRLKENPWEIENDCAFIAGR